MNEPLLGHGAPDETVSEVRLVFASLGGALSLLSAAIAEAVRAGGTSDDFTNGDLTPIILKLFEETRE